MGRRARARGHQPPDLSCRLSFVFLLLAQLMASVYFPPLLNDYKPLPDGPAREAVLSLARANGVPTNHVEWFDASKQTKIGHFVLNHAWKLPILFTLVIGVAMLLLCVG